MRTALKLLTLLAALTVPSLVQADTPRTLTGAAHNVTVGVRAAATLIVDQKPDGTYALSGGFDNINLAGDVTGTGRAPTFEDGVSACAPGHECILFTGQIMLDSRAGFADGTATTFILSLDIEQALGTATGTYHIGLLPGFPFEQYGIVQLAVPTS
ncbi:hypothetical protein [Gymnodinialimonas sp.]